MIKIRPYGNLDELYELLKTAKLNNEQKVAITQLFVKYEKFPTRSLFTMIKTSLINNQSKPKSSFLSSIFNIRKEKNTNKANDSSKNISQNKSIPQICYINLQYCSFGRIEPNYKKAFVMMPFSNEYQQFYESRIKKTVEKMKLSCSRADEQQRVPNAYCNICKLIQESGILITDMTGLNVNVFLEIGMCLGRGRRVILLCNSETKVPFDTSSMLYIRYDIKKMNDFSDKLRNAIKVTLEDQKDELKILYDSNKPSGKVKIISKTLDEIYKPLYARVVSSIELLQRGVFECGIQNNNLGERILVTITGLKQNIYWNTIDNDILVKLERVNMFYKEIFEFGQKMNTDFFEAFRKEFNNLDLAQENTETMPILDGIRQLSPFIFKEFDELDDYRKDILKKMMPMMDQFKEQNSSLNDFWSFYKKIFSSLDVFSSYLAKRNDIEELLNDIKVKLSEFLQ